MNSKSLEKELKNLRFYLKTVSRLEKTSPEDDKVISHTIAGMLITVNNLIDTGAYFTTDHETIELYQLIKEARDNAIHYGYFDDYSDIYHKAKEIVSNMPEKLQSNFAKELARTEIETNRYVLINQSQFTQIYKEFSPYEFFVFKNLHTNEELRVKKDDLIVVENKHDNHFSYVFKKSDEKNLFYKVGNNPTSQISVNEALDGFFKVFDVSNKKLKLDTHIQKLIDILKDNPYSNTQVCTRYDDKHFCYNIHNVLTDYLYNKTIDERILTGKFTLIENEVDQDIEEFNINQIREKELSMAATLLDVFYMELYLKRYNAYRKLKSKEFRVDISDYTKQSMLLSLFEFGAGSFSDKFLKSDTTGTFMSLFYKYKSTRNKVAHLAVTNTELKQTLINSLETYSDAYYQIISKVYNSYCKAKFKNPYTNLSNVRAIDTKHDLISNKTSKYYKIKHTGLCKIIDGKKYLKIDTGDNKNNVYIEVDRSLLILDYNTFSSKECIIPIDGTKIVDIDLDTNSISKSTYKIDKSNIVDIDTYMVTLLQARDYLKSHPQYDKNTHKPYFCALTVYNDSGKAIYSEGISHVLYRRYCQKVIPSRLLEVSSIILPKNMDESILLIDKNKKVIASAYLGCIDYSSKNETLSQLLVNKEQKEVDYGKLLSKDLETKDITMVTKEGRIR